MTEYPYMISNNKIPQIIEALQKAARPEKLTQEVLSQLGFRSTNDRAFIPLMKKLGFLNDNGNPTALYDNLKDKTVAAKTLAKQISELYCDLFAIDTEIYKASDEDIKGAIARTSGKDEKGVDRVFYTFKTLCSCADFNYETQSYEEPQIVDNAQRRDEKENSTSIPVKTNEFHYNIQIHLPATNDISVFNAIFKSLKDNLLM